MKKPSNKWLYIGIITVLCLTFLGIIYTMFSYYNTQKHALKMGQSQLTTINNSAVKILQLELTSYTLMLENNAIDILNRESNEVQQQVTTELSAAEGIYQIQPNDQFIKGRDFQKQSITDTTSLPEYLKADPLYSEALKGKIPKNGEAYFYKNKSYLNLYLPMFSSSQVQSLIILPINLEKIYQANFQRNKQLNGYSMVKDQNMEIIMHPSSKQIGLSVVKDRKKKFPNLDYSDLQRLEKVQRTHQSGTLNYYSYWWTDNTPKKVLKMTAYRWITIGNAKWIIASVSDFNERNGTVLQENLIILALLTILLIVIILLGFNMHNYAKRNQIYLENIRLKERQVALKEKHSLEKNLLQESKLETVGLLTTTIVHDMNNFLTPMIGNLQLLIEEHKDNELLVADLNEVYHAAEMGQQLSSNVLRFSRVNSTQKKTLSIIKVIEEALNTMTILIPKNVSLTSDFQMDGVCYMEKDDLQIILYNLITNAYQACDKEAVIQVRTYAADKSQKKLLNYQGKKVLILEIRDNGPGIPKEIEDKIFTPFFTTKPTDSGTGLGLFIVSSIIKKNDWVLEVESSTIGTVFQIALPIN
ncbi:MAG: sensor histidine kinase [Enterococcus hulanensis]